jgi:hypothetical protein
MKHQKLLYDAGSYLFFVVFIKEKWNQLTEDMFFLRKFPHLRRISYNTQTLILEISSLIEKNRSGLNTI